MADDPKDFDQDDRPARCRRRPEYPPAARPRGMTPTQTVLAVVGGVVLLGCCGIGGCVVLVGIGTMQEAGVGGVHQPDPKELAAEVKPLILKKWREKPELHSATIQDVTLVHKGGNTYTGLVNATIDGKTEWLKLEVIHDGQTIFWELTELGN
ncbi:MAG: hypothetical protein K2X82_15570 [Gemmataceae bacterium]|nr:hypothetical protein [Gemmataceae bacterium]